VKNLVLDRLGAGAPEAQAWCSVIQEGAMADKPVDTEGARADLRFGNQYFDRWFKQDLPKQKEETFSQVLKYTEQARKKDPSVTLQVKSEEGEVKQVTPDSLAAALPPRTRIIRSVQRRNWGRQASRTRTPSQINRHPSNAWSIRRSRACLPIRKRPR